MSSPPFFSCERQVPVGTSTRIANRDTTAQSTQTRRIRRGVIGVLTRDDRHLVIQRAAGIPRGGHWCFPGGHLEQGETSRRAVQRELFEELGLQVTPTKRLGTVRLPDAGYILAVWRVGHILGSLRLAAAEVADARWLSAPEIHELEPSLASNLRVLEMLRIDDKKLNAAHE